MLELFLTIVAAILVGAMLSKFWREILTGIVVVFSIFFSVVLYILTIPLRIIAAVVSRFTSEEQLIKQYDKIFFEADSMYEVAIINRKVKNIQLILKQKAEREKNKELMKQLDEAKWVL